MKVTVYRNQNTEKKVYTGVTRVKHCSTATEDSNGKPKNELNYVTLTLSNGEVEHFTKGDDLLSWMSIEQEHKETALDNLMKFVFDNVNKGTTPNDEELNKLLDKLSSKELNRATMMLHVLKLIH